ncbi:fumarate hydratase [Methanobrevibacter sp. 87.7]|uniref:fumarate hydratase n=1 Tax=Methanobrevibacter sp. 87.7 TaxID=387957 RepID=UPI000B511F3D|nr:fumarate hydratase [Methanobrevibacter sp. 87.7]OWT32818.1 fumarate hydratase [Methanobrevibacter sp. 87.7]
MSLVNEIKEGIIKASTQYSEDRINKFKQAIKTEENLANNNAVWALKLMLKNAEIANSRRLPLCDDTGIPHVLIELGKNREIPKNFLVDIKEGIKLGLKELPGRPMAVKGEGLEKLDQSKGLYDDPSMMLTAPFSIDSFDSTRNDYTEDLEDEIHIHLLLLGGGPEIRSKTFRVFHKHDANVVINETISWLSDSLKMLGCTPAIPAIGIGRSHYEASHLMLKAMVYGNLNSQSETENYITNELNKLNIGPMGLKAHTTVLGTFLNIGPQRASGVRIVSARPCCFVEPRISTIKI